MLGDTNVCLCLPKTVCARVASLSFATVSARAVLEHGLGVPSVGHVLGASSQEADTERQWVRTEAKREVVIVRELHGGACTLTRMWAHIFMRAHVHVCVHM